MRKIHFEEKTDFESARYRILLDYIIHHSDEYNMVPAPIILNEALYQMEYFHSLPNHTYDVWDCIHDCMDNIKNATGVDRYSRQTPGYVTIATLYILLNLDGHNWYNDTFTASIAKVLAKVSTYDMFNEDEAHEVIMRILDEENPMFPDDLSVVADEPIPNYSITPLEDEEQKADSPFGSLQPILDALNNHTYTDLDEFLKEDVDWFKVKSYDLIPREKARAFVKAIKNRETRLQVMRFLIRYLDHYFEDVAVPSMIYTPDLKEPIEDWEHPTILHSKSDFYKELSVLIEQLTSHDFNDEKFSNLKTRIVELEKQNKQLGEENEKLQKKIKDQTIEIDNLKHPEREHFIPSDLDVPEFEFIMEYLNAKKIVTTFTHQTGYGPRPLCYVWAKTAPKTLFGYLVDRVSFELDLRKNNRLNWKLFRPAFRNYDEIIKQSKDAVSRYKYWAEPQDELPQDSHLVDEAIAYAEKKMKKFNISSRKS